MNDINLIPDKILYKNRRIAVLALRVFLGIIAGILVLALLSIRTYQRMELQKDIRQVSSEISAEGLAELEKAEAELSDLKKESDKVEEVYNMIPQGKLKLSELLERVSKLMPAAVTADSISYSGVSDSVVINVKSSNPQAIALFLKRLHDDQDFVNINISGVSGTGSDFNCSISADMKDTGEKK